MPLLEKRRIYAAGGSLAVTLPKGWLKYFGIKAGDEVEIVANDNLVIRPVLSPGIEGIGQVRNAPKAETKS